MHKKYIDKIIALNDTRKMEDLEQVLLNIISYMHEVDPKVYNDIECDLYEIAEGKRLDEEKAKLWVENMHPKAKWTIDDIQQIKLKHKTTLSTLDAYIIMNMLYSDFGDVLGEDITDDIIEKYIQAAEDWYYDEDTNKTEDEKLYFYWKCIVS